MNSDRRAVVLGLLAYAIFPPIPVGLGSKLQSSLELTDVFEWGGAAYAPAEILANLGDRKIVIDLLRETAARLLGKDKRYEIRMSLPEDFGRRQGIAWYRASTMDKSASKWPWEPKRPEFNSDLGLFLVGRFIT